MMAQRLREMKQLLKPTGSIYLHCDDAAVHYLKVLMDAIFGKSRIHAAVTWRRAFLVRVYWARTRLDGGMRPLGVLSCGAPDPRRDEPGRVR